MTKTEQKIRKAYDVRRAQYRPTDGRVYIHDLEPMLDIPAATILATLVEMAEADPSVELSGEKFPVMVVIR